ncbi:MAG: helix-turn-helix transcriptional regulator [Bacteroidota bacterium]|nr:helix-turn-helix transcriptional regulator [Bacteroidota bacterium]
MDEIVIRIELILKARNLSPSKFADEIGVQRSSISHIMSGRNKPSLDLIMKILSRYQDLNTEWLLSGVGVMNKEATLFDSRELDEPIDTAGKKVPGPPGTLSKSTRDKVKPGAAFSQDKKIEKVLVFYNDKTFEEFLPGGD